MQGTTDYQVEALFRTGSYINVQIKVPSTGTPSAFNIYADRATINSPYPQLYLIYQLNSTGMSYTTAFGSFNIGEVWNARSCQGVNIDLMSHPAAKFEKEQQQIKPSDPQ